MAGASGPSPPSSMEEGEEGGINNKPLYLLVEPRPLDAIFSPIKTAQRVKYTCFDVSRRYLVCGSTSGGIFVFLRETLQYLKTVTNKEGSVSQVAIAPDESVVAFSTSRGHTVVLEHNAERENLQPHRLQVSYEHKGSQVTCLQWGGSTQRLYVGDDTGRVSILHVAMSKTRSLFQVPSSLVMKADSRIVQLDYAKDHLLISSLTRVYVYSTNIEQWVQIGKKLREGEYGACFYPGPRYQDPPTIFSARPGYRLWQADLKGEVMSTHQFKAALSAPPVQMVTFREEYEPQAKGSPFLPLQQNTSFSKLLTVSVCESSPFILTWNAQGLYIFNPKQAELVLWNNQILGLRSIRCYKGQIYCRNPNGRISCLTLQLPVQAITTFYQERLFVQAAQILFSHQSYFAKQNTGMPSAVLNNLTQELSNLGRVNLATQIIPLISSIANVQSPCRARSALADRDPVYKSRTSPKPTRCRSASPLLRRQSPTLRRPSSGASQLSDSQDEGLKPVVIIRSNSLSRSDYLRRQSQADVAKRNTDMKRNHSCSKLEMLRSSSSKSDMKKISSSSKLDQLKSSSSSKTDLRRNSSSSRLELLRSTAAPKMDTLESQRDVRRISPPASLTSHMMPQGSRSATDKMREMIFKPLVLVNGVLSPVDEGKAENSPMTGTGPLIAPFQDSHSEDSQISRQRPRKEDHTSPQHGNGVHPEVPSYLLSFALNGGGFMFPPNYDFSAYATGEFSEGPAIDLSKIKDSISTTITSGKKVLLQNLRGLENKWKQGVLGMDAQQSPTGSGRDLVDSDLVHLSPQDRYSLQNDDPVVQNGGRPLLKEPHDCGYWDWVPSVDMTSLMEATVKARSFLNNPEVVLDPGLCTKTLEEWLSVLHSTQAQMLQMVYHGAQEVNGNSILPKSTTGEPIAQAEIFVRSPFHLTSEEHTELSEIATACFRAKVTGSLDTVDALRISQSSGDTVSLGKIQDKNIKNDSDIKTDIHDERKALHDIQNVSQVLTSHDNKNGVLSNEVDVVTKKMNSENGTQHYFGDHCVVENKNLSSPGQVLDPVDHRLASFLRHYFYLLGPEEVGKIIAEDGSLDSLQETWSVLMKGLQKLHLKSSKVVATEKFFLMDYVDRVVVAKLAKLVEEDYFQALSAICRLCHQMSGRDLLYLSLRNRTHHPQLFLESIGAVLRRPALQKDQSSTVYQHLFASKEVRQQWLFSALEESPIRPLRCACGQPLPGSHLYPWRFAPEIQQLLTVFHVNEKMIMEKCREHCFWPGCLLLWKQMGPEDDHLLTIAHLGDQQLLSSQHPLGCFPSSEESWLSLLCLCGRSPDSSGCLTCSRPFDPGVGSLPGADVGDNRPLSVQQVASQMLTCFPPRRVLHLLRGLDLPPGTLSSQLFQAAISTHLIKSQQSLLSKSILARMESYLWSRRSKVLPPQIWHILDEERKQARNQSSAGPDSSSEKPTKCFLEEPESQWGVRTRIQGHCPLCNLPLAQRKGHSKGVTVCSCGHAYHANCLMLYSPCPVCIDRGS